MPEKKKILVLIDWFLPGNKAGGPVKSISSLVNTLNHRFDFYILTSDKDLGSSDAYENITSNNWAVYKENIRIYYLSDNNNLSKVFLDSVNEIKPEIVYINSFFSKHFSIIPLRLIKKHHLPVKTILAPRGMLSPGALKIKAFKKKLFIAYSKLTGIHSNLKWHSTKSEETTDIHRIFPGANIHEAQNISDIQIRKPDTAKIKKQGALKLVYLGRIARNKNLLLVLESLMQIRSGNIILDIFGMIEDKQYWENCENIIKSLPENISVHYKRVLQPDEIQETLIQYHFLIQLSFSENYGHSIVEALSSGVPVLISNTTPWKELDIHKTGWDVGIKNPTEAVHAIKIAAQLTQDEYNIYSVNACKYAERYCLNQQSIDRLTQLFND